MNTVAPKDTKALAYYAALFLALFFCMQTLYQTSRGTAFEHLWIDNMTVLPSAGLIAWLTPNEGVVAQNHRLLSPHVRLSVLNGCEGTEVILLLTAALLALRLGWRRKLLGIIIGGLLVYTANQLRIVTLYYCLRFDRSLFDALHGTVAPLAVIFIAALFFIYWTSHGVARRIV